MTPQLTTTVNFDDIQLEYRSEQQSTLFLPLRRSDFIDEKERKRFIKNVERLVRASIEYKEFISFVKFTLGKDFCALTLETDVETNDIEIHHHPLTLYDIVESVVETYIARDKKFNTFDIASEVIECHFSLKIGFVPLLRSLHKKFHLGNLKIPIEFVQGNYKEFLNEYDVPEHILEKVSEYEKITIETVEQTWYPGIQNFLTQGNT